MGVKVVRHNPAGEDVGQVIEDEITAGYAQGWRLVNIANTFAEWIFVFETPDVEKRTEKRG